jgi:diguanylate cyclase (GGDEF)-like protein
MVLPLRNTLVMAGKSFLLISKSPVFMKAAEEKFLRSGINVVRSTGAKEGFQLASRDRFDLIICAHSLPEMAGSAFLELLAAQKKTRDIPSMVAGGPLDREKVQGAIPRDGWLDDGLPPEEILRHLEGLFLQKSLLAEGAGKVMAVDDSPIALKKFEQVLKDNGYQFRPVIDPKNAIDTAAEFLPDLILMDQNMPDINGFDLSRMILAQRGMEGIKIVMVSSDQKKETVIKALECGVVDFLSKPFDDEILLARMRAHITNKKLFDGLTLAYEQMEKLNQKLEALSATDGMTGLCNHRRFVEGLMMEIGKAESSGGQLALVILDIDHFKIINDAHGHLAGDEALKAVAKIAAERAKGLGMTARYGGEEFAIILPGKDIAQAAAMAEDLRKAVEGAELDVGKAKVKSAISLGAAAWSKGMTADQLIALADKALYQSKHEGRNRVTVAKG